MPKFVLKLAKTTVVSGKIHLAIWSGCWYLAGSHELVKWVRLSHLQIELRKQNISVEIYNPSSVHLQINWRDTRFFSRIVVLLLGQGCHTLVVNCLTDSATCGVTWSFRLCNRTIAKSQTALSVTSALITSDKGFHRFITIFARFTRIWTE